MKVEAYKPLDRSDISLEEPEQGANPLEQVPKYVDDINQPIHSQLKVLTRLSQHQISFSDNMNAEVRDVAMRHLQPAELTLTKTIKGKPIGVIPLFWDAVDFFLLHRVEILDLNRIRFWPCFFNSAGVIANPNREVNVTVAICGG